MMKAASVLDPKSVLEQFELAKNIYLLGTFERNLTIYNQQVRALNFAWSLTKTEIPPNVAIIGGGFAGLTAAAGLLRKGVGQVSIFEKRATLLPLQQGSDARWVHPHIYDWPDPGSELPTAALPLLNWNAGRASDVVVQVLNEWDQLIEETKKLDTSTVVEVFCNVKHLRLARDLEVEWVGEKLESAARTTPSGSKRRFDCAVLAVGFGLELNAPFSYWRNETLGQPELDLGRRTYLVSGHGDGALIDLFRIRISQFRQDRILVELFSKAPNLRQALQALKHTFDDSQINPDNLYDEFEHISDAHKQEFEMVLDLLRTRLRSDTAAILRMSPEIDRFEKIFRSRASFQNRFLLFALYRAGGIIPVVHKGSSKICAEYGIRKADIVRRHGPNRLNGIMDVMDGTLAAEAKARLDLLRDSSNQPSTICWSGGYWDERRPKVNWRKEHLPAATEIMVTGFIAGVAGYLEASEAGNDFRVTFHRIIHIGSETLLQQSCRYIGTTTGLKNAARTGDAARVFKLSDGTIGYAARIAKIVRTRPKTSLSRNSFSKGSLHDLKS
jgi:FAD dependent oxidoreductase